MILSKNTHFLKYCSLKTVEINHNLATVPIVCTVYVRAALLTRKSLVAQLKLELASSIFLLSFFFKYINGLTISPIWGEGNQLPFFLEMNILNVCKIIFL